MKDNELDESKFYRKSIAEALNRALSHYDEPTANHSERVGTLAGLLAAQLDLDRPDRLLIAQAGIVHDVGKLGIRPAILAKTGPLTPDERTEVQRHSAIGAEMLLDISPDLAPLAEGVRAHHERWDGTGYPDGLAGDEIPLFGRLLAVVDVYDALTSPRIYRNSHYTSSEAMTYLEEHAGTQFDPQVVRATLDILRG
jgi:HD-GYP domain-containing protein (c-di-GMP phosphodiesterase class II)